MPNRRGFLGCLLSALAIPVFPMKSHKDRHADAVIKYLRLRHRVVTAYLYPDGDDVSYDHCKEMGAIEAHHTDVIFMPWRPSLTCAHILTFPRTEAGMDYLYEHVKYVCEYASITRIDEAVNWFQMHFGCFGVRR